MSNIYITWRGTDMCGYSDGDVHLFLESAKEQLQDWIIWDKMTWDEEQLSTTQKNGCGEPCSYIEVVSLSEPAWYAVSQLTYRIACLEAELRYREKQK